MKMTPRQRVVTGALIVGLVVLVLIGCRACNEALLMD